MQSLSTDEARQYKNPTGAIARRASTLRRLRPQTAQRNRQRINDFRDFAGIELFPQKVEHGSGDAERVPWKRGRKLGLHACQKFVDLPVVGRLFGKMPSLIINAASGPMIGRKRLRCFGFQIDRALRKLGERRVSLLLLPQRGIEELDGLVETEFPGPRLEGAIPANFVMLDGLSDGD